MPWMLGVLRQHNLLTFGQGSIILIAPPLIITEEQVEELFSSLDKAIEYVDGLVR